MQNNCFKKIQKQPPEASYKKVVVNSQYCEIFESTYFEEHLRKKKRLSIRNFYVYILYIKETSENVCFYFMKETSENAFFFSWLFSFRDCIQIRWETNSKNKYLLELKSLVTIRMNGIFPCLACCGLKLNFHVRKSRQR